METIRNSASLKSTESKKTRKRHNTNDITIQCNSSTLIQPLRITLTSQFRNNPFSRHNKKFSRVPSRNFMEYTNYKTIPDDDCLKVYEKKVKKKHNTQRRKGSMETRIQTLNSFNLKKEEPDQKESLNDSIMTEMINEINMGLVLTDGMEKELKVISKLLPITSQEAGANSVKLPKTKQCKHTILLDLDETLIHSLRVRTGNPFYNNLPVFSCTYSDNKLIQFVKRPFLDYFLTTLAKKFELIVLC